jgi:hypothetical protein
VQGSLTPVVAEPPFIPWVRLVALGGCALAAHALLRLGAGLWGALGTDAPLWGLTARDLLVGAPPLVPPGYPALVAALIALGLPLVPAAVSVSMVAAAGVPPAVFWLARRGGASPAAAGLGAVLALLSPDVAAWAQQVQPDSLAALLTVLLAGALFQARTSARAALIAAGVAGLLPLVREHGLPLAVVAGALLLHARRFGALGLLTVLLCVGPLAFGGGPWPWAQPWSDRSSGALAVFQATGPESLPFLRELHRGDRAAYLALVEGGDRVGQLAWHARRALSLSGDGLLIILVAVAVAAPRGRLLGAWLPLLAAAPALVIWSQRRHVLLLLPLALAVAAAGAGASGWRRRLVVLLVLAGASPALMRWPEAIGGWRAERARAEHFAEVAGWIAGAAAPGSALLGGVYQDIGLYARLPRHDPDGSEADWLCWFVGEGPPLTVDRSGWEAVYRGSGPLAVWRKVWRAGPDLAPRPCQDGRPIGTTPHLAVQSAHAEVEGCRSLEHGTGGRGPGGSD